jgi:hypothetical protein
LAAQTGHVSDRDTTVLRHHERLSFSCEASHFVNDGLFLTAVETQGLLLKNVSSARAFNTLIFSDQLFYGFLAKPFKQRVRHLRWLSFD